MKRIIITDTHFGIKQNSINWFNSQKDFIYNELIPYIKNIHDDVLLYHCGDVFDSRSSINPLIAKGVRQIFEDLSKCTNGVYIIGGNHDYYSPNEDSVTGIEMVLIGLDNVHLITNQIVTLGNDMFVPWYEWNKTDTLKEAIEKYKPKAIFCHTDLSRLDDGYEEMLKNVKVFSGHIHTPLYNKNLITLGSTYALTFSDHNSERGFYVLDEDNNYTFVAAKNIIKFYRYYNNDIFSFDYKKHKNDYIEFYIDKINLINERYVEYIKECSKNVQNLEVIPISEQKTGSTDIEFSSYNIEDICRNNIPENLKEKFEQIVKQTTETRL